MISYNPSIYDRDSEPNISNIDLVEMQLSLRNKIRKFANNRHNNIYQDHSLKRKVDFLDQQSIYDRKWHLDLRAYFYILVQQHQIEQNIHFTICDNYGRFKQLY